MVIRYNDPPSYYNVICNTFYLNHSLWIIRCSIHDDLHVHVHVVYDAYTIFFLLFTTITMYSSVNRGSWKSTQIPVLLYKSGLLKRNYSNHNNPHHHHYQPKNIGSIHNNNPTPLSSYYNHCQTLIQRNGMLPWWTIMTPGTVWLLYQCTRM